MRIARTLLACTIALFATYTAAADAPRAQFHPGKVWLDTDGQPIEAHGGGILMVNGTYYWYGENHHLGFGNLTGISAYSSHDLLHWKNEGVVFPIEAMPAKYRGASGVCERPHVLYNPRTRKYVMWVHLDGNNYTEAVAGVATSDSPTGPFTLISATRPIQYDFHPPADDKTGQKEKGGTFRDMNVFQDDDGSAYVVYSSEGNWTLYIARLDDSFTAVVSPAVEGKTWARALIGLSREAPAPFKHIGRYFLFSSGTTGWAPNPAAVATAPNMLGPWTQHGNPAVGKGAETTFDSQSTNVVAVPGKPGAFIFMGDRWDGSHLQNSTYVWLPFVLKDQAVTDGELPKLEWIDDWDLGIFDRQPERLAAPVLSMLSSSKQMRWTAVAGADHYLVYRNGEPIGGTSRTELALPQHLAGRVYRYAVVAANIHGARSPFSAGLTLGGDKAEAVYLSDIEPDSWHHQFGPLKHDAGVDGGPIRIAGKVFAKGIGTHAFSEIVYRLGGSYRVFHACVGGDNAMKPEFAWKPTSVEFHVVTDGTTRFESGIMYGDTPAKCFDINMVGVNELRLLVTDGGNGTDWDHADWADAKLLP